MSFQTQNSISLSNNCFERAQQIANRALPNTDSAELFFWTSSIYFAYLKAIPTVIGSYSPQLKCHSFGGSTTEECISVSFFPVKTAVNTQPLLSMQIVAVHPGDSEYGLPGEQHCNNKANCNYVDILKVFFFFSKRTTSCTVALYGC